MPALHVRGTSGFSLIETVIAASILVTALAGTAQLLVYSLRFTRESGRREVAAVAAQSGVEWLRARAFAYGPEGDTVTDAALEPSPPNALDENVSGYFDALDAGGEVIDLDEAAGGGPAYVRRWAVTPLDSGAPDALAIEVCVFRGSATAVPVASAEACLATIRTRQP